MSLETEGGFQESKTKSEFLMSMSHEIETIDKGTSSHYAGTGLGLTTLRSFAMRP